MAHTLGTIGLLVVALPLSSLKHFFFRNITLRLRRLQQRYGSAICSTSSHRHRKQSDVTRFSKMAALVGK